MTNIDNDCGLYGIDGLPLYDGGVLENAGSLSLTDNTIIASDGSAGAQVINDVGASISYDGSSSTAGAGISAPFTDKGAMNIGQGTLSLGSFSPATTGVTTVGLSAAPGQLSVSGAVKLNGALVIATQSGYLPKVGTKVTMLTAGSRKGKFSNVTGTQLVGEHWVVSYKATSVTLSVATG